MSEPIIITTPTLDNGSIAELSQDNIDSMTADELQTVSDSLQNQIDVLQAQIDTIQPALTIKLNAIKLSKQIIN